MRTLTAIGIGVLFLSCTTTSAPKLQPFDDGNDWIVMTPMKYGDRIVVPAGFVTDLASVPRALCTILPSTGSYLRAAILHDFLYWDQTCTRDEADALLRTAMLDANVPAWKREAIYAGVRVG